MSSCGKIQHLKYVAHVSRIENCSLQKQHIFTCYRKKVGQRFLGQNGKGTKKYQKCKYKDQCIMKMSSCPNSNSIMREGIYSLKRQWLSQIIMMMMIFWLTQQNRSGSDSVNEDSKTPESLKMVLGGSSEESKSARILRHLQSRVKQLRQGNQSMKKSFGSDEGDADGSINNSSLFEQVGFNRANTLGLSSRLFLRQYWHYITTYHDKPLIFNRAK